MRARILLVVFGLWFIAALYACNLPAAMEAAEATPDTVATWVAASLTAQVGSAPIPSNTPAPVESATPEATATGALPTPTPQNPLVLETTLCWQGPGAQYEVVSALKKGERVELIGQGSLAGWWIVNNPIYHDPCWAQAKDLQIEPSYDISGLKIFYPPPTPTSTPSNTPTPTNTP